MAPKDHAALQHILEALDLITEFVADNPSVLIQDRRTRDAVVFNLAVIGEAVKNLSEDLKTQIPGVPWKNIAGMRDRLIHGYFAINNALVVEVVEKELPSLKERIISYLEQRET